MQVQIVLQLQTGTHVHGGLLTQEQPLGTQEQPPLPGTQLQVQTAPGGSGEPHGIVYVTPSMVYVAPLTLARLAAGSIRQTGSCLPSGNDHSLMVSSPPLEASSRPSGLMASATTVAECPVRVFNSFPSGSDHSLTVLSWLPEASSRPSGLMANVYTCWLLELPVMRVLSSAPAGNAGVVIDPSGASVPAAAVTVTGAQGSVKVAQTDAQGRYTVDGLLPGIYTVRATAKGFGLFEKTGVDLTGGGASRLDIQMIVVAERQEVTVSDTAHVDVDPSANVGALVLKGTDLDSLSEDPDDLQNDLEALAGPAAGPNGGQIYIDGFTGGQLPPKESIREIRINQNPFSAEYDKLGFGR